MLTKGNLPFVVYHDVHLILQMLPGGFLLSTPDSTLFIDGGTHELHKQQPCLSFDQLSKLIAV